MDDIIDMYGNNEEDNIDDKKSNAISYISKPIHTEIMIDGHVIKIIDFEYVTILTQRLQNAEKSISEMQKYIAKLENDIRNKTYDMTRLARAINNKVDKG